jgi:serine/threonine protein kinase
MDKTIREDSESGDPKQGDADLTIREEVQGIDATLVEGAASEEASPSTLNLVPGALFEGYRLKEPLKVTSAEADLWQVEDAQSGKPYVLKLYRYGIKPKEDIGHAIRKLRREHIVEVLKSGEAEGRLYEIQESIEHGSLADWGKKGKLSDKEGQEVLRELSEALAHLHEANVVHRDIKPSNILIRTEEPLDLVLIDFGIASMADLSLHLTNLNRTAAYCAPETIQGVVGKESDWWSVGVVMLEMLEGRHPWGGMTEQAINFQLVSRGMKVPEGVGREWGQLLKGLLTRDVKPSLGAFARGQRAAP